jgi:hypothetical protein
MEAPPKDLREGEMVHSGSRSDLLIGAPVIIALATSVGLATLATIALANPAHALPSYARQTGQPCGTCHTDFPALTPYGRRFKLLGYTTGGGPYRPTPFSGFPTSDPASDLARLTEYAKGSDQSGVTSQDKTWVPPISGMAVIGYTHTQAPLSAPTDPYQPNDNIVASPFSFFYAGAITQHIGAFAQVTYNAPPAGGFGGDPFGHTWTWDNTDIRFADVRTIGGVEVIYGITANNNPTVQDVWNTTPAWAFPYAASTLASTPATKTLIEGALAAHVVSAGAYTFINNMLYLEGSSYWTLNPGAQNTLGTDPFGAPGLIDGAAPYWRVAFEPHWNNNSLMIGAFGMYAKINPWVAAGTPLTATLSLADTYTDIGYDAQYQYQGDNFWVTLRGSYIHELQNLGASQPTGAAANATDTFNTLHLQASLAYGNDHRFVITGQYFNTWGSSDPLLYAGLASTTSPNSNGYIGELAYIPFGASLAPGWPWANARIALQYTWYDKFDGTTVGAHNNDTLFLHAWLAF